MARTNFIKNIGLYFLGNFSTKILQFLFIPIYSKFIDPTDLGTYNLTVSAIFVSIPLLYQSVWEGGFRFSIENKDDEYRVLSLTTKYCMALTVIYSIIFLIVSYLLNIRYAALILLIGIGQMGTSYWQYSARALKENKIYSISTVANTFISIALNVILIVIFKMGLPALLIANMAGNLTMIVILEIRLKLLKNMFRYSFDKEVLKQILKYSLPLAINAVSWWLFSSCNNVIISKELGLFENGIFALAMRFGSMFATITAVISMAWQEEAFRTYDNSDRDVYFNHVFNTLSRVLLSIVLLLIPATFIVYKYMVFGSYQSGVLLTSVIYLGAVYNALSVHLGSAFLARKESHIMFVTTLLGGILTVILSFIFVHILGLMGAVIASLIGYISTFVMRIPLLKSKVKLELKYSSLAALTILCMAVSFACNMKPQSVLHQSLILLACSVFTLYINKKLIRQFFNKLKSIIKPS